MAQAQLLNRLEAELGETLPKYLGRACELRTSVLQIAKDLSETGIPITPGNVTGWLTEYSLQFDHGEPEATLEMFAAGYAAGDARHVGRELERMAKEREIPRTSRLQRDFFERQSGQVAPDLLGRYLFVQHPRGELYVAQLRDIEAFTGETESTSDGASYEPGKISVSVKYNQPLIDVSTGVSGRSSCITLRGGDVYLEDTVEAVRNRPGILARRLGIMPENAGDWDNYSVAGRWMWIEGDAIDRSRVEQREGKASNSRGIFSYSD